MVLYFDELIISQLKVIGVAPKTMKIPIEMCSFALSLKYIRPFQLYIDLKFRSEDIFKLNIRLLTVIASDLNLKSHKTILNNLEILISLNWLGFNPKTGYFFVRSFDRIRTMNGFNHRSSVEIELSDIKKFKAFIAGAVIGNLVKISRRRALERERLSGRSLHRSNKLPDFYPVANLAISKILKISISTAWKLKDLAHREGYIVLKKNFKELKSQDLNIVYKNKAEIENESLNISAKHCKSIKLSFPEYRDRIRVRKNSLWVQEIDTVKALMNYRKRRKLLYAVTRRDVPEIINQEPFQTKNTVGKKSKH